MIEKDPTGLNFILNQNNDREEPVEIYEVNFLSFIKKNLSFFLCNLV